MAFSPLWLQAIEAVICAICRVFVSHDGSRLRQRSFQEILSLGVNVRGLTCLSQLLFELLNFFSHLGHRGVVLIQFFLETVFDLRDTLLIVTGLDYAQQAIEERAQNRGGP